MKLSPSPGSGRINSLNLLQWELEHSDLHCGYFLRDFAEGSGDSYTRWDSVGRHPIRRRIQHVPVVFHKSHALKLTNCLCTVDKQMQSCMEKIQYYSLQNRPCVLFWPRNVTSNLSMPEGILKMQPKVIFSKCHQQTISDILV